MRVVRRIREREAAFCRASECLPDERQTDHLRAVRDRDLPVCSARGSEHAGREHERIVHPQVTEQSRERDRRRRESKGQEEGISRIGDETSVHGSAGRSIVRTQ